MFTRFQFQWQRLSYGLAIRARFRIICHFEDKQFHAQARAPHRKISAVIIQLLGHGYQVLARITIAVCLIEVSRAARQQ